MLKKYSEYSLVERAAIEVFKKLDYSHINCLYEEFGPKGTLGRETKSEVVLVSRLRAALLQLNQQLTPETIVLAVEELTRDRSSLHPVGANREIYQKLRDGVKVTCKSPEGKTETETVKVIDFAQPKQNDFLLVSQFWITGEVYTRRADLIGFVNGLPLIFIELKATHKRLEDAYSNNLSDYKMTIPQLFWYNAFIILSNGSESKIGTISAGWEHFYEWKKIGSEGEEGMVSLDTILQGTCDQVRFFDIVENFLLYLDMGGSFIKVLACNHQYLGVNNAIRSFEKIRDNQGKLGVFWHTQGSGKSFSMIFFSQKILRKFYGNHTFVIVTDRIELDKQIYKNFADAGAVTEQEVHAESCQHLQQLLQENHRNIFTLIQKFRSENGKPFPVLSQRSDIIVIADEAHRTQYNILASNMRRALPHAAFIAFTATPLIVGEEPTREMFGDYVSIYHFQQSVADGATVPLYYEVRKPELQLVNDKLDEQFAQLVEEAMLDAKQEKRLLREFAREYQLLTRDDRLEKIAEDIVEHFMNRGYMGKAMVISLDKPTAVKMYDKVQKYWQKYIAILPQMDMAVVLSEEQGEVVKFQKLGLEITRHRKRVKKEDLETKFKNPDDPFWLAFVCAKWMTGFDVPCLSTIYLDKPLHNHTLMQTIARANRVFGDKPCGMIVDYYGVFRDLQKALAIYGVDPRGVIKPGATPVKPKEEQIGELEKLVQKVDGFFQAKQIVLADIGKAALLDKIRLLDAALDAVLVNEETKREFVELAMQVRKLYQAILPDPRSGQFAEVCSILTVLTEKIRIMAAPADISSVIRKGELLLDQSIKAKRHLIQDRLQAEYRIDLSQVDVAALQKEFQPGKQHIQIERAKNAIQKRLQRLVLFNRSRIKLMEKFQEMIAQYNGGSVNDHIGATSNQKYT
jgi:type I restriction enzyme R subunit